MKMQFVRSCALLGLITSLAMATPIEQPCPSSVQNLPEGTTCWGGKDEAGAYYWIAKPKEWNGNLVLHSHGGPSLGKATQKRADEDFERWSIWVRSGNAFATSSFRQGGVELMAAAEDTARLLPVAQGVLGKTNKVILHGQSWGAGVAARAAEENGPLSKVKPKIDGVLLTNGLLAGGTRSYDFRLDLRAVWQVVCNNHPRPNETQYPLWQGLPKDSTMSNDDFNQRVNECLGLDKPAEKRSAKEKENIETIVNVIKVPESSIPGHLRWATRHFQDIVWNRLDGRNPFGNDGVVYTGSKNDTELNKKVLRYKADPTAVKDFGNDTNPTGNINHPILTTNAINDAVVFVEIADSWKNIVEEVGKGNNLVQTFVDDNQHSYISDVHYVALMNSLIKWIDTGKKPTSRSVANECKALGDAWTASDCRFLPDFKPAPLSSRVPPR